MVVSMPDRRYCRRRSRGTSIKRRTKGYAFPLIKSPQRKKRSEEKNIYGLVTSNSQPDDIHQVKFTRKGRNSQQQNKVDENNSVISIGSKRLTQSNSEPNLVSPVPNVKEKSTSTLYPDNESSINPTDDNRRKTRSSLVSVNVNSLFEKKIPKQPRKNLRKSTIKTKKETSASKPFTSSLLQSARKGNKFKQQRKRSDLPHKIIPKDSERVTRSSFVGIHDTSSLKKVLSNDSDRTHSPLIQSAEKKIKSKIVKGSGPNTVITNNSEPFTSSLLQSTRKENKLKQQRKRSDLSQNMITKDSEKVTRSSFVGIHDTSSLKKVLSNDNDRSNSPVIQSAEKKMKSKTVESRRTVESSEPNTVIANNSEPFTSSLLQSAGKGNKPRQMKSKGKKRLRVKVPVNSNCTGTGRKHTTSELIPETPGLEAVRESKTKQYLSEKQTVNSPNSREKRTRTSSESIPFTPVFKVRNKSRSMPPLDIISSMNDMNYIASPSSNSIDITPFLKQVRTKNKPQLYPGRRRSGRITREANLDTLSCVQFPFATPLPKEVGKGVKSFKEVIRNIPIDGITATPALKPSASRLLTKNCNKIFDSPLSNSRKELEHSSMEVKLKNRRQEVSETELCDGNKADVNSRSTRTKGIKRGSQHSQEAVNSKRKKKMLTVTPVINSDICPLGSWTGESHNALPSSSTSLECKNNKKLRNLSSSRLTRKSADNLKSNSVAESKDSNSSFSTPDLTKISIDELCNSSSFVSGDLNCVRRLGYRTLPAAVKRKVAVKMPGSLPIVNRGPKVQGKGKMIKSGTGLNNSVPKKGTLKRKRWILNTLKGKNEGYEDDIFESQQFKAPVLNMPIECDEESDVSSTSISTPKFGFFLTPAVPKKTPKYKDCISPTELLIARKSAEEYLYRRNKKRTSGGIVSQNSLPLEEKTDDNSPEKKKLDFTEVMGKLSTIQKDMEKNNEDQSEEEDDYFSDVSV